MYTQSNTRGNNIYTNQATIARIKSSRKTVATINSSLFESGKAHRQVLTTSRSPWMTPKSPNAMTPSHRRLKAVQLTGRVAQCCSRAREKRARNLRRANWQESGNEGNAKFRRRPGPDEIPELITTLLQGCKRNVSRLSV